MGFIVNGILGLLLISSTAIAADTYIIDKDHSSATFIIRHLVGRVNGSFSDIRGKIIFDEKKLSKSSVETTIKTESIDTKVEKRDNHLKSPDFFETEKFPDITFVSKKIKGKGKKFKIPGILSIRGIEKLVTLDADFNGITKDPWGNTRAGFAASTKINRKDFGLTWNKALEAGGFMVGDEVAINLEIEAIKEIPKPVKNY